MKKNLFFLFTMLASVVASATVTVTPISTDYANRKVTFKVAWTDMSCNNRVWVWVDLCPVTGSTPTTFQQAVISAASATAGSIVTVDGNQRGFYVTTNPSTVTATLSNATGKFNWCVYGSDYPPNATSYNNGTYTLKGTPPFIINGNGTIQDDTKYVGTIINTLTDATGYPGGVARDQPHNGGACAPGLTIVGSYCRDLCADNAITSSCNSGIEVENTFRTSPAIKSVTLDCPVGWRVPTLDEMYCLWSQNQPVGIRVTQRQFVTSTVSPNCYHGTSCYRPGAGTTIFINTRSAWGAFSSGCGIQNWQGAGVDVIYVCTQSWPAHGNEYFCVR